VWEYLEWLTGYEYLSLPSWPLTISYFLFAGVVYVLRMYIYIIFLHPKCLQEAREIESIHGPQVVSKHDLYSIFIALSATTIGPVAEEAVFRGPVLWFVEKSQYGYALLALVASSMVFALCHVGESYGKYRDGSNVKKTKSLIQSTLIGGVFYGVFVIITGSLWPGIFLHILWNVSAIIIDTFYKEKFNVFALSLQR